MAREAAILSVLVSANTTEATAKLTKYQKDLDKLERQSRKGIKAQLGGSFDSKAFRAYQEATDKAVRKAQNRRAFKAELGANFSPAGFRAYQKALDAAEAETKAKTGHMAAAFNRAGSAMKTGLKAGALALGAAGVVAGKLVIDFDRAMRNVNSIAQLPEKQFKRLEQSVLNLAGKTAQAPKTLAEGLYDLVSSGFNAKQAITVLSASAKAATAGLTDTATSTRAVAAVLNAYHRPASDAAKVSDTLFQTVNLGVISFEELANTIGDVLPFASQLHVGLNQVGAAISTMTKAGINPAETMTRIKVAMEAMIKPSTAMTKTLHQMGYESGEALIKQKGFQGALEALAATTGGSKEKLAALFPNIRALGGALALTGMNTKSAERDLHGFANTSGATSKALSQQSQSISYQWNLMRSKLEAAAIQFALKVGPLMIGAIKGISAAVEFAKTHAGEFANAVVTAWRAAEHAVGSAADHILGVVSGLLRGFASVTGVKILGHRVFGGVADDMNHAADSIDHLRDRLRALGETHKQVANTSQQADQKLLHANAQMASGAKDATDSASGHFSSFGSNVGRTMQSVVKTTAGGVAAIGKNLNSGLHAFGASRIPVPVVSNFNPGPGVGGGGKPAGAARGGLMQIGRPGEAGRDSVPLNVGGMPIMVAPGEQVAVFNRHQLPIVNAALGPIGGLPGLFQKVSTPNYMASGGMANLYGHPGNVSSGVRSLIGTLESRFPGLIVTATTDGGHAAGSYHYRGDAVDMASDAATMLAAANYVRTSGMYRSLIEGIHNPNLSIHAGQPVSPSFWGASTWAAHANHIHLAILGALGALAGGGSISAPRVRGGGAVGDLLRAGFGKVAAAASNYLISHTGGGDSGSFGLPGGVGTSNAANRALGRQMMLGYFPASQWPYLDALWNKESGWSASARNPSSGAAGIPQDITGNFHGGAAGQIAWGLNYIKGRYGSPAAAWAHESKFNWYGKGGMLPFAGSFDQGGTVPGPRGMPSVAVVHGGERITGLAGGGIIGRALAAHPAWRIPLNLPALATIPSQSTSGQIQVQGIQNQLQSAQNTGNTGGQKNALTRLLRVERSWLAKDKAKLKTINAALRRRDLSKKQRSALLQDKLNLLQEINTVESDIGSTQTQLSDLSTSTDTTGGGDTGGGDTGSPDTSVADAINANTQMLADIKASIDAQNQAINGITQVELKQALKAFSDVVSGQIGGLAYSRSVASAGDGRVARY